MRLFQKNNSTPIFRPPATLITPDPAALLGTLNQLGTGRIIANNGPLSLAITADFRPIHPKGHHLVFAGGVLELKPESFQLILSTAACGLGLAISFFDHRQNLQLVFHFCHGSDWGKWLDHHTHSGLLQAHPAPQPALTNLCWCELWPQPANSTAATATPAIVNQRIAALSESKTIETTIATRELKLSAVIRPANFDILTSAVRFWDRPRTRVCYADLAALNPFENESYIALHN